MRMLSLNQVAWMTALGLSACTTTSPAPDLQAEAAAREADERSEAGLMDHHRHQHRGGVMQFIAMGLDTLDEGDAQRPQVQQLQRDMYVCMASSGEIQKRLHLAIAEGIAAGAVDLAKIDGIIGELDAAGGAVRDCSVAALDKLHALLNPSERAELVEKVQAHYEVWLSVNHEEEGTGRGRAGRLTRLAKDLSLTPDQVERMSAALHTALAGRGGKFDRTRFEAVVQEFSQTFVGASFDAKATLPYANARLGMHGASRMAIFYETVTPMLSPPQRAALAEQLRQHAGHHPNVSAN